MIVHKYSQKHYDMILEWQERRGSGFAPEHQLSKHGAVVEDVACGFLYCTDSSIGMIEFFISNPEASTIARAKALDLITSNLMIWAKELGMSKVFATTKFKGIKKLAMKYGFEDVGEYSFLSREL